VKLSLLHCHYAPREARNVQGHKDCWPAGETRTLTQLIEAACPARESHAPDVTNFACVGCGLYLATEERIWPQTQAARTAAEPMSDRLGTNTSTDIGAVLGRLGPR
jgi:hypothetical protein